MLNRIKTLFKENSVKVREPNKDELQAAAAALLVEAACMDGNFDDQERKSILILLEQHFNLNDDESSTLLVEAEKLIEECGRSLYFYTCDKR